VAEAAIERVEALEDEDWVRADTAERARGLYEFRRRRFRLQLGKADDDEQAEDPNLRSRDYQQLQRELLGAQREALQRLRREGHVGDEALRRVERDLDLEENRLEGPSAR
jgi:CPA1 family monovalent cation:H+ antiporter